MNRAAQLNNIEAPGQLKAELRGEVPAQQPAWLTRVTVDVMHAARGTVKRVASALNVREGAVYEVADLYDPKPLKAWWIAPICRETGSFAILDAIEAQVGRVAFVLPTVNPHVEEMNRELARTVREFGAFLETNGDALADGHLEAHEVGPLLGAIDTMLAGLSEYRALVVEKARADAA